MLHHRDIRTVDTNGNRFVKKLEQQRNLPLVSPGGFLFRLNKETQFYAYSRAREDKGDREGIPNTHPIPQVIRLGLFLESG